MIVILIYHRHKLMYPTSVEKTFIIIYVCPQKMYIMFQIILSISDRNFSLRPHIRLKMYLTKYPLEETASTQ
jgi:hypothetical protein